MAILITGDIHLNAKPRDRYRHDWQIHLRALVKKHGAKVVIILGDLTDEKDFHPAALVNAVVDHLWRLSDLAPVVVLKGNHDYAGAIPFFAFLGRIEGVYWVGSPLLAGDLPKPLPGLLNGSGRAIFLPHTRAPAEEWARLPLRGVDLAYAHATFAGASGSFGKRLEGIPTSALPVAGVISGDIHSPQTVDQVVYAGSPYTCTFGEDFEPRVLLLDGEELHSIPSPGPNKRALVWKPDGTDITFIQNAKPDDIVKIEVQLRSSDFARWAEINTHVRTLAEKKGYVVHSVVPDVAELARVKRSTSKPARSDRELFEAYVKARKIDKATAKVGLALLEEKEND